ncbi:basic proline-rich protein-like [Antechinus flavipes]|uniref:basic proline-rich protein-like n=1 Tax=Antechinus flavipes TaxID=38775 RepID=UPI002235DF41|nr:basic proline-rich protein-like [Antechinus flavipes]
MQQTRAWGRRPRLTAGNGRRRHGGPAGVPGRPRGWGGRGRAAGAGEWDRRVRFPTSAPVGDGSWGPPSSPSRAPRNGHSLFPWAPPRPPPGSGPASPSWCPGPGRKKGGVVAVDFSDCSISSLAPIGWLSPPPTPLGRQRRGSAAVTNHVFTEANGLSRDLSALGDLACPAPRQLGALWAGGTRPGSPPPPHSSKEGALWAQLPPQPRDPPFSCTRPVPRPASRGCPIEGTLRAHWLRPRGCPPVPLRGPPPSLCTPQLSPSCMRCPSETEPPPATSRPPPGAGPGVSLVSVSLLNRGDARGEEPGFYLGQPGEPRAESPAQEEVLGHVRGGSPGRAGPGSARRRRGHRPEGKGPFAMSASPSGPRSGDKEGATKISLRGLESNLSAPPSPQELEPDPVSAPSPILFILGSPR